MAKLKKVCANCRWWGIDYDRVCDKVTHIKSQARIAATADDDQGLDAKLVTDPDFSCSQFEARR